MGQLPPPGAKEVTPQPLVTFLPSETPGLGPGSLGLGVRCDQSDLQDMELQLTLPSWSGPPTFHASSLPNPIQATGYLCLTFHLRCPRAFLPGACMPTWFLAASLGWAWGPLEAACQGVGHAGPPCWGCDFGNQADLAVSGFPWRSGPAPKAATLPACAGLGPSRRSAVPPAAVGQAPGGAAPVSQAPEAHRGSLSCQRRGLSVESNFLYTLGALCGLVLDGLLFV